MKYFLPLLLFLALPFSVGAQCGTPGDSLLTGLPDLNQSYVDPVPPSQIIVTPSGNGTNLAAEGIAFRVTMVDYCLVPIVFFPFQDIWAESVDGGMVFCMGGTVASANTNADGVSIIEGPFLAGGYSEAGFTVYLTGTPLVAPILPVKVNSPDITGDLVVNIADVGVFAEDFIGGAYSFRSDFYGDETLNIADVAALSIALNESCP